jgi:hypothetical protein
VCPGEEVVCGGEEDCQFRVLVIDCLYMVFNWCVWKLNLQFVLRFEVWFERGMDVRDNVRACCSGILLATFVTGSWHGYELSHLSRRNALGGHEWETFCWELLLG